MEKEADQIARRTLTILSLDAKRLFERIRDREVEYLHIFSKKRTRDHFHQIFQSIYLTIKISDLQYCSEDVIVGLDFFYTKVEEMKWYMFTTEDMPGTFDNTVGHFISELNGLFQTLSLYIEAELETIAKEGGANLEGEMTFMPQKNPEFDFGGPEENGKKFEYED